MGGKMPPEYFRKRRAAKKAAGQCNWCSSPAEFKGLCARCGKVSHERKRAKDPRMTRIKARNDLRDAVTAAAMAWWASHKPVHWSIERHIETPAVNAASTDESFYLATACGAYKRLLEEK